MAASTRPLLRLCLCCPGWKVFGKSSGLGRIGRLGGRLLVLALADARCLDNGGKPLVLFSPAANRGYEERLPAPSLCLCTCTVLVPSSPHHRICSLSCVSSFLGKYFTRHARQLFRSLSLAHSTLADAPSCANFEATASASLSHPCFRAWQPRLLLHRH
jgi:hypothetical protein